MDEKAIEDCAKCTKRSVFIQFYSYYFWRMVWNHINKLAILHVSLHSSIWLIKIINNKMINETDRGNQDFFFYFINPFQMITVWCGIFAMHLANV